MAFALSSRTTASRAAARVQVWHGGARSRVDWGRVMCWRLRRLRSEGRGGSPLRPSCALPAAGAVARPCILPCVACSAALAACRVCVFVPLPGTHRTLTLSHRRRRRAGTQACRRTNPRAPRDRLRRRGEQREARRVWTARMGPVVVCVGRCPTIPPSPFQPCQGRPTPAIVPVVLGSAGACGRAG